MGTQKEIAKQIINRKADYILALKGNQSKLHQQVKEWFEKAKKNEFFEIEYSYDEEVESGHHRIEKRQVYSVPVTALPTLHNQKKWKGLKTVVMVLSERKLWNKTTSDLRFYISSLSSDAELFMKSIRSYTKSSFLYREPFYSDKLSTKGHNYLKKGSL